MKSIKTASLRDKAIVTLILASILLSFSLVTQIPMEQADAQSTRKNTLKDTGDGIDWERAVGLYNEGLDLLRSDRYEEAISYYDRALDVIFPSSGEVTLEDDSQLEFVSALLNGKGSALTYLGQYEDARKLFENALEFDSNNTNAQDNLEVVMSELNEADDGPSTTAR